MSFLEYSLLTKILIGVAGLLILVFGEAILEILLQAASYFTALVILPLLTLGRVRVETHNRPTPWTSRWYQIPRNPQGIFIISTEVASLIGLLIWAIIAIILFKLL